MPDARAPKKKRMQNNNDDDAVIVDNLVPTKKTPGIDDNTKQGPFAVTPPPPQPPDAFTMIQVSDLDAKHDDDMYLLIVIYIYILFLCSRIYLRYYRYSIHILS